MQSFRSLADVVGVELSFSSEKAGGGRAVDADELAPCGGGHADVVEVGGKEFMGLELRELVRQCVFVILDEV